MDLSCSSRGNDISSAKNNQCIVVDIPRVLSWSDFSDWKKSEPVYSSKATIPNSTNGYKWLRLHLVAIHCWKNDSFFGGLTRHQESSHSQADVSEEWLRRKRRVQKVLRLRTSRSAPANTKPQCHSQPLNLRIVGEYDTDFRLTFPLKLFYFEWSPPWLFKALRALLQTLSYKSHCKTHSIVLACFMSSKVFCETDAQQTLQFHFIFGDSLWLRSCGEHFDPELAVEVCRGTLWSRACGGGPAGNTLIQRLLLRSGGEHCDLELAVEVRRGAEEGGGRRKEEGGGGQADIKSDNPHLTCGEKTYLTVKCAI